jgi:thioredoxin reductase (NADPH)
MSGADMMQQFRKQAERLGARIVAGEISGLGGTKDGYALQQGDAVIETRAVILAMGAQARRLPIPSEARFYGKGISGCATCDGAFFRDKDVLVVGGGNTAVEDAVFLTRFARTVTIVHRREHLRAAPVEVEKTRKNLKIRWMIPWVVEDVEGDEYVVGARLTNPKTGETRHLNCDGVFIAIGHDPKTECVRHLVECDAQGYVKIEAGSTRTSAPGIFACGDVCDPVYKQAVVAAGTGCMAALDAQKYLET